MGFLLIESDIHDGPRPDFLLVEFSPFFLVDLVIQSLFPVL